MEDKEKTKQESEERYRAVFEQCPIGIGLASLGGKVLSCNKAMETITGYTIEELKKLNLADTYENPKDRKRLLEAINRDGGVANFPVRLRRKDGTLYYALLNVSRVHTGRQDFLQTLCLDISKRKKAEESLEEEKKLLERMNKFMMDRELRIIELKRQVNSLLEDAGKPKQYEV